MLFKDIVLLFGFGGRSLGTKKSKHWLYNLKMVGVRIYMGMEAYRRRG
jgi:hypothetical protein